MTMTTVKRKYLVALTCSPNSKGFCHPTILVSAIDGNDAICIVRRLRPNNHIGEIKEVNY